MVIIETKMLNVSKEKMEEMREWVQKQTQQEVILLPMGCKLVEVTKENTIEETELTNAEKIRGMTEEELAKFLMCPAQYDLGFNRNCECNGEMNRDCVECTKQWLQMKEVEKGR